MPGFGEEGQNKLAAAKVVVFGAGGLGSPACTYLAMAGVGRIVVVDRDAAELSNLNRQFLHTEKDARIGKEKAISAMEKLNSLNPSINVIGKVADIGKDDLSEATKNADVLLDCLDNYAARMVVNDLCLKSRVPLVHAGIEGMSGHLTAIIPGRTPCLGCILPPEMAGRGRVPVLGAAAGVFGSIQAAEAVKIILNVGETLSGRLLIGDLMAQDWEVLPIEKRRDCVHCSGVQ
jgi:molybdopterin/thiamine biosynthesis adenylyltransferase